MYSQCTGTCVYCVCMYVFNYCRRVWCHQCLRCPVSVYRSIICVGCPRNIWVEWCFVHCVCETSKAFVHSINHVKGFWTKVERCCATLPLYRETPEILCVHIHVCVYTTEWWYIHVAYLSFWCTPASWTSSILWVLLFVQKQQVCCTGANSDV